MQANKSHPPTPHTPELQFRTYTHYHCPQLNDLADLLEHRGWERIPPRRRTQALQMRRGLSSIVLTPSGCVSAKGPGAVVALHLAHVEPNDADKEVR